MYFMFCIVCIIQQPCPKLWASCSSSLTCSASFACRYLFLSREHYRHQFCSGIIFLSASICLIFAIPIVRAVTLRLPARIRPVASFHNIAAGFFMSVIGHLQCKFPHHQQNSNAIWKYQVDKRYICFGYISRTARCAFHRPPANRAAGYLNMGLKSFSSQELPCG